MSDEDEPAPSPSAAVVARRASRIAKSLREESGCEEDTSSDDEWDPAQEQDEEDEEDEQDERNQGLADASTYGRSRLHEMPRARKDGTGEEMRNALFGKRLGRRTVHLHGLAPSGDAAFEAVEEVGREAFLPGEQKGGFGENTPFIRRKHPLYTQRGGAATRAGPGALRAHRARRRVPVCAPVRASCVCRLSLSVRASARSVVHRSAPSTQVGPRAPRSGAGAGPEYDYG